MHICSCEYYSQSRFHLFLRNIDLFDIEYLQALLLCDYSRINQIENKARAAGYGPLAPCQFVASAHDKKQLCRELSLNFIQ